MQERRLNGSPTRKGAPNDRLPLAHMRRSSRTGGRKSPRTGWPSRASSPIGTVGVKAHQCHRGGSGSPVRGAAALASPSVAWICAACASLIQPAIASVRPSHATTLSWSIFRLPVRLQSKVGRGGKKSIFQYLSGIPLYAEFKMHLQQDRFRVDFPREKTCAVAAFPKRKTPFCHRKTTRPARSGRAAD